MEVVDYILTTTAVQRQALQSVNKLIRLERKYDRLAVESACIKVVRVASAPTITAIEHVLKNSEQKQAIAPEKKVDDYGYTRGANYFEGKSH